MTLTSSRGATKTPRAIPPEAIVAAVDPFSISPEQWELIEGNLFGASLFPYLAFLYYLSKPEVKMPPKALFGFKFLLVFVFGTIPCAIFAKLQYDDILANVDWLHGPAESLLTITNLFIVVGMREGLREARSKGDDGDGKRKTLNGSSVGGALLGWSAFTTVGVLAAVAADNVMHVDPVFASSADTSVLAIGLAFGAVHSQIGEVASAFSTRPEPANALSLPTWIIHTSSLIEWVVAMGLIWEYADVTGNKAYKGLTWGMVPCHASGIAACTFHVFYNAPVLSAVVATQAGLTVIGNTTCAIAAYRMAKHAGVDVRMPWDEGFVGFFKEESAKETKETESDDTRISLIEVPTNATTVDQIKLSTSSTFVGWEDLADLWAKDSNTVLVLKLFLVSTAVSAVVKWGSLGVEFPFHPSVAMAFGIIFLPTGLNMLKWAQISREEREGDAS
jgi:hypothetical protein